MDCFFFSEELVMKIKSEIIDIVASCDDNYIQHLGVMLTSLLENTHHREKVRIWVIDGGISASNKNILSNFINDLYDINIFYIDADKKVYQTFKLSYHFTPSIFYRISIPDILPDSVEKVIYLDSDLIFQQDIDNLWSIDIGSNFLGAVESLGINIKHLVGVINQDSAYFNSGVLIINVDEWRKNNISQKLVSFIAQNQTRIIWPDQDALNVVLYQKWLKLPLKWNLQSHFFGEARKGSKRSNEVNEAIKKPAIIHYTGMDKPWNYVNNHPYKSQYYQYLILTPWRDYKPKKNIKLLLKKVVKMIFFK